MLQNPNQVLQGIASGDEKSKESIWARLRPTAVVLAIIMAILAGILINKVLGGELGASAFGEGQAVAVVTAALLVIGAAVNALGSAMLKLSEDAKPDPPPSVPETTVLEQMRLLAQLVHSQQFAPPAIPAPTETHARPREGIADG